METSTNQRQGGVPRGKIHEIRFDKKRMIEFVKSTGKDLLKYSYCLGWNSTPRFVHKGEEIFTVKLGIPNLGKYDSEHYDEYPIVADYSGYLINEPQGQYSGYKNVVDQAVIATILEDPYDVAALYPSDCVVVNDEFDGSLRVEWVRVCGKRPNAWSRSKSFFSIGVFSLSLILVNNVPTLRVEYDRNEGKYKKGDRFELCFDGGNIISLVLINNPVKSFEKKVEFYLPLNSDNLSSLLNNHLLKVRLTKPNCADQSLIAENNKYFGQDTSSLIFQEYVQAFWVAISDAGFSWERFSESKTEDNGSDREPCYVYLMVDTANGYYKIGISNNPEYREGTLQSEKPTIELLCAKQFPSRVIAKAIESALHRTYEDRHMRGEWFQLDAQDIIDLMLTLK